MNVLHIITGIGYGGAEKVVYDLCRFSKQNEKNKFYVISLDESEDRLEEFRAIGVDVLQLNMKKSLYDLIRVVKQLQKFIIKNDISIIHAHMFHACVVASCRNVFFHKIPLVFTAHSKNIESKTREYILKGISPFRDHDILFSEEHHQFYNLKRNYSILPNGVDVRTIAEISNKSKKQSIFTFINVARFNVAKNHMLLLDVVKKLKLNGNEFQLWLVGDGELRSEIESKIVENDISDIVSVLGLRKDIPDLLGSSHAFVLPSKWEGLPISVLEAASASIPVITTPVGNLRELLYSKRGYCIEESELESTMENVILDYEEAKLRASKLKKYVSDNFSIEYSYKKHIELYSRIC